MCQVSPEATRESNMLSTLVEMIHEEFAFDGYLDDGVEDVNMGKAWDQHPTNWVVKHSVQ